MFPAHEMRRQLSLVLMLTAGLLASGSHWDLVQTFAWGRMFVHFSQSMPLLQAAQKTFSVAGKCHVCSVVQEARQQQDADDAATLGGKSPEKIFLLPTRGARVFATPASSCTGVVPAQSAPSSTNRAAPPNPPPRAFV